MPAEPTETNERFPPRPFLPGDRVTMTEAALRVNVQTKRTTGRIIRISTKGFLVVLRDGAKKAEYWPVHMWRHFGGGDEPTETYTICQACNGTGQGRGDVTYCGRCGGDGTHPILTPRTEPTEMDRQRIIKACGGRLTANDDRFIDGLVAVVTRARQEGY